MSLTLAGFLTAWELLLVVAWLSRLIDLFVVYCTASAGEIDWNTLGNILSAKILGEASNNDHINLQARGLVPCFLADVCS